MAERQQGEKNREEALALEYSFKESSMVDSGNPLHKGNQAFIDEDYPTTLQVRVPVSWRTCYSLHSSVSALFSLMCLLSWNLFYAALLSRTLLLTSIELVTIHECELVVLPIGYSSC